MSHWTHVAAIIRFDALRLPGQRVHPPRPELDNGVPTGSEGPLSYHLRENQNPALLAAYVATIWGDLRDYDSVDEIVGYLDRIVAGKIVRQGVCSIEVEGRDRIVLSCSMETAGLPDKARWNIVGKSE